MYFVFTRNAMSFLSVCFIVFKSTKNHCQYTVHDTTEHKKQKVHIF